MTKMMRVNDCEKSWEKGHKDNPPPRPHIQAKGN